MLRLCAAVADGAACSDCVPRRLMADLPSVSGVLVVNVTWRGKTYVGTLLDYTRHHDWAPPR